MVVTAAAMVEATEGEERAAVATVAVTVAAMGGVGMVAAAMAVATVAAAMAEVAKVVAMVVAVRVAVVRVAAMVAAEMAAVTEGCRMPHLHSSGRRAYEMPRRRRRCDRYCPALQHAARQETRARTPPTSRSAGHPGHSLCTLQPSALCVYKGVRRIADTARKLHSTWHSSCNRPSKEKSGHILHTPA